MNTETPLTKIHDLVQSTAPLPQPVWLVVKGVSHVQWLWRLNQKRELYQNPDHWLGLAVGHTANLYVGNGFIRTGAHLLLVATKVQDYVDQVARFRKEVNRLADAIDGLYLPIENRRMVQYQRIKHFTSRSLHALFALIMHAVAIYDSLYRSEEAMQEVVINGKRWLDTISNNKKGLVAGLNQSEKWVNELFQRWHLPVSCGEFTCKIEKIINVLEVASQTYHRVNESAGALLKQSMGTYMAMHGLGAHVPEGWLPSARHPSFVVEPLIASYSEVESKA